MSNFVKSFVFLAGSALSFAVPSLSHAHGMQKLLLPTPEKLIETQSFQDKIQLVQINSGAIGEGAQSFIQNMADDAIGFLGNPNMGMDQKKTSFRKLLKKSFDMKTIGRFSLGRYWRISTPQQREEYQKLFEKMVIEVYSQRFAEYEGQKFETRSFREDGTKDTLVTSFILPEKGPEIQVDWRVRYKDGKYKVVDIIVEGVSMSVTQRSDFSSVIQRGGGSIEALLVHLRAK